MPMRVQLPHQRLLRRLSQPVVLGDDERGDLLAGEADRADVWRLPDRRELGRLDDGDRRDGENHENDDSPAHGRCSLDETAYFFTGTFAAFAAPARCPVFSVTILYAR